MNEQEAAVCHVFYLPFKFEDYWFCLFLINSTRFSSRDALQKNESSVVNDDCRAYYRSYIQHHVIVCFLLPLPTLIYEHCIQSQKYHPVTGVDDRPYDQNNLF